MANQRETNRPGRGNRTMQRLVAWFLASAILFGTIAALGGGQLNLLQTVGAVMGVALAIAFGAVLLERVMDKLPRSPRDA